MQNNTKSNQIYNDSVLIVAVTNGIDALIVEDSRLCQRIHGGHLASLDFVCMIRFFNRNVNRNNRSCFAVLRFVAVFFFCVFTRASFGNELLVMRSLRLPKRLTMHGDDERDHMFLVRGLLRVTIIILNCFGYFCYRMERTLLLSELLCDNSYRCCLCC